MIPKDSSIKQQIAIVADIRTEGKNHCSPLCQYCKQDRVTKPAGSNYTSVWRGGRWEYNYCTLFKEQLYGHNGNWYPKRRPKCLAAMVQKTANDLSDEYRLLFTVNGKDGEHKVEFNSHNGELIRPLLRAIRANTLEGEFKEDDVVLIRLGKVSDWPK
jgi:hypothetical protein